MKKTIMAAMFAFILLLPIKLAFWEEKLIIINLFEDDRSRTAEAKMKEAYPGLQIEYRWVEDRYTLTTHFLSMDSEMDIVCFNEWDGIKGMYPVSEIWQEDDRLGDCLISGLTAAGSPIFGEGSMQMDLTQTSFSKVPSVDIELGNAASDHSDEALSLRASGLAAGVDAFFGY